MREYLYSLAIDQKNGVVPAFFKAILRMLSLIYTGIMIARRYFYQVGLLQSCKLPKPVISVGNVTLGGVGKTPITIYLAELLKSMGKKPVVLIRGYMLNNENKRFSDEARLLELRLNDVPVLVGKDRIKNALEFLKFNDADVFIMDDGFQHQKLKRDLDIVAIDATNPWGNGCVLPRGILREPLSSLKSADVIFLTKTDLNPVKIEQLKDTLKYKNKIDPLFETIHKPIGFVDMQNGNEYDVNFIQSKKVALLSSIANPDAFVKTVKHLGADIAQKFIFSDHYLYNSDNITTIKEACENAGISVIVTTEKDAVKLAGIKNVFNENDILLTLKINLQVTQNEEQLVERIHRIF